MLPTNNLPAPLEMLKELREGPYRPYGGLRALAADLGTGKNTLEKWLNGTRNPSFEAIQRIRRLWESYGGKPSERTA